MPPKWPTVRQVAWTRAAPQGTEVIDHGQVPAEPGGQVQSGDRKDAVREGSLGSAFGTHSCRNEVRHEVARVE
jgi:hypothetical protein